MSESKGLIQRIKGFFQRAKVFINEDPQRKKFLLIILILVIIPITAIAALTVQNLRQHAGGGTMIIISDQRGNILSSTSDPNIFIDINLNSSPNWVLPNQSSAFNVKNNIAKNAYAFSASCSPPYGGYLGCFSADMSPSGSICTSSCTTTEGQGGQYCYTSTKVGLSCTTDSNSPGTCNNQGDCIGSSLPPTSAPTSIPNPQCTKDLDCVDGNPCTRDTCRNGACGYSNAPAGTVCDHDPRTNAPIKSCNSTGQCAVLIAPPISTKAANSPTATSRPQAPTATPVTKQPTSAPTATPAPNILRAIYIENKDTDGSTGGSAPVRIMVRGDADIKHISWRLNGLLPGQGQAPRAVQVTLIGDNLTVPFATTVNLVQPDNPISWTISSTVTLPISSTVNSISGSNLSIPSSTNYKKYDLNGDDAINCRDTKILIGQYGQKGTNLPSDLNHDGTINEVDYNEMLRNYTPGDATKCTP